MRPANLPTDLLRTFITVTDLGGYTRAGHALNRTQPAVSLQMKRLEDLVGEKLLVHDGRRVNLTSAGTLLAGFARQILQLNDEAMARFRPVDLDGRLRVGLPTDYAVSYLQNFVTGFVRDNAAVDIEMHCDVSRRLLDELHGDRLDLAVALIDRADARYLVRAWEEQPIWTCGIDADADETDPVPLVTHPDGCAYRNRMVETLNRAGRNWRIAYSGPGIAGLQDAVVSGLGVSALTRKTLLDGMRILTAEQGFPLLEKIGIGLFYKHPRQSQAGLKLVEHLISGLDEAADGDFMPSPHPAAG